MNNAVGRGQSFDPVLEARSGPLREIRDVTVESSAAQADGVGSVDPDGTREAVRERRFDQKAVIRYALSENADVHQRVMRLLYENKRVLGARLTEDVVAERLWTAYGFELDTDAVMRSLDALVGWGAIDRQHDAGHARSLEEFKRRRFNYAITQAGELAERFLEDLDNLRERIGALEGSRLQAILAELGSIVRELESGRPEPQRLRTALDNLRGELEALDQGASDFMAQLANVLASSEAINDESFLAYKDRVIGYLTGFASQFRRSAQRIEDQIVRVEELGVEPMLALAASVDEPPVFGKTPEEVTELRRAEKRDAWRALSAWFVASSGRLGAMAEALGHARGGDRLGRLDSGAARRPSGPADRSLGRIPTAREARAPARTGREPPDLRRSLRPRGSPPRLRDR